MSWFTLSRQHVVAVLLALFFVSVGCEKPRIPETKQSTRAATKKKPLKSDKVFSALDESWREWTSELSEMSSELELSAAERTELEAMMKKQSRSLGQFYDTKLKPLEEKARVAMDEKDLMAIPGLIKELAPLRSDFKQLLVERKLAIAGALSDDKREVWEGHVLAKKFWDATESMELSDDQKARIKELAVQAAKDAGEELEPEEKENRGFARLEAMVQQNVFQPAQKSAYNALQSRNPLRGVGSLFKDDDPNSPDKDNKPGDK